MAVLTLDNVLIAVLALYLLQLSFKKLKSASVKLPPGPYGVPIVGYLLFLGGNIHQTFMELAKIYGPIYKLSIGQKLCVLISSPTLAKQVLRDQDIAFANRNPTIAALAFSSYGPEWRMLRKIFVHEMQSNANLDAFYALRRSQVKKSVGDVYAKNGKPIDVRLLAFSTVINMITSMFWGGTLEGDNGYGDDVNAQFRDAVSELLIIWGKPNISDFFPFLASFDIQRVERDMKRASRWIEQIFDFVVDRSIRNNNLLAEQVTKKYHASKDFLDFLLEFKDHETGNSLSRPQIKAFLADIVIGGTGTTSTAFEWTMTELMLHPEVMKKAQDESIRVIGASSIVEEYHIHKLPYLQAVVKETLRLHPSAPLLLPRCPARTCTVGGYTVEISTPGFRL